MTQQQAPTLEEAWEQLDAASRAHDTATAAVKAAETAFFESGDESALDAALAAEKGAARHLSRAQHLFGHAKSKREAEERAALEQQLDTLEAELDGEDERLAEALIAEEAAAFERVVAVRERRLAHNQGVALKRAKVSSISRALGHPRHFDPSMNEIMPSHYRVGQILRVCARGLPGESPRSRWLYELAEGAPNYHPRDPLHPLRQLAAPAPENRK